MNYTSMVYGLSNDPLEALKGLKKKGATPIQTTPNLTSPKSATGLNQQLAEIGGYAGGFTGITKPTVGTGFSTPKGADQTAMVNMPQEVQKRIVQEATAKPTIDTTEPQFMETNVEGQITEQSPSQLYADLKAGMPVGEASKYYPEYAANLATINELKADIDAGMPETMIPQYYPEFYPQAEGTEEQQRGGGLKGSAAAASPIYMGKVGEMAINPVGRVAEIIDNQIQKIGSFDFTKTAEENLDKRVASLTQKELEEYQKKREKYKKENPGLSKMYTKTVEGNNLLAQMWNIVTGDTKDRSEVDAFKDFVRQNEKKFVEELAGADTKGPHFANMIANIPGSAVKTVSAVGRAVLNPADTLAGLGKIIFTEEGRQLITSRYGSWEAFAKTLETDPVGVASDVLAVVEGGAGLAKAGATAVGKVAARVGATETAATAGKIAQKAGSVGKTAGVASDLGLRQILPKGLSTAVKATENIPVVGKAMKYGEAMTTPLKTIKGLAKDIPGVNTNKLAERIQASANKLNPSETAKYKSKIGQSIETTMLENDMKGGHQELFDQSVAKSAESQAKLKTALKTVTKPVQSTLAADSVEHIISSYDRKIPGMDKVIKPFEEMAQRLRDGTASIEDLQKAKTMQAEFQNIFDQYGQVPKGEAEKKLLADNYMEMKNQIEDIAAEYGIDIQQINHDIMKFEGMRRPLGNRLAKDMNLDIFSLTDSILAAGSLSHPAGRGLLAAKKIAGSPGMKSKLASKLYKKTGITGMKPRLLSTNKGDVIPNSTNNSMNNTRTVLNEGLKALPSPETVTPSNLGTRKNPIKGLGEIGKEIIPTGRKRHTVGWSDAPEIGDDTKLGKIVDVQHTSGGFPTYSVKIEGYKNFMPADKIEGGIYEGVKTPKSETPKIETKQEDVMPREEAPKERIVDEVYEFGDKRKYYVQNLVEELGFKSIDDIEDINIRNDIAEIIRMKNVDKIEEAMEKLKSKIANKEKPIPLSHKKTDANSNSSSNSNPSNPQTEGVPTVKSKGLPIKAMVKAPEEPLMAEARKYKSAEEFVKAQGEPVYHGTNAKFDKFSNEYIGKSTDPGIIGEGHYFTNNNTFAKGYVKGQDGNIIKAYIPKDKLFDMSTLKNTKQASELLGMDEKSFYRTSDGKIIPKDFKASKVFGEKLQKMGYDGAFFDRYNNGSIETVIFNPDKIKTESQLKQIREEANKSKGLTHKK